MQENQKNSEYQLAGVSIPTRNILCTGEPCRSVAILDLADQVAAAGKRMVIYDKAGEFVEVFYRPDRDYILNPLDARDAGWNVRDEADQAFSFARIPQSLLANGAFSINRWVAEGGTDSRLFITSNPTGHAALASYLAACVDCAIRAALAGNERSGDLWFFLDELVTLQPIEILPASLASAPKLGLVHVIGCDSTTMLARQFRAELRNQVLDNLHNRLTLRALEAVDRQHFAGFVRPAGQFDSVPAAFAPKHRPVVADRFLSRTAT